MQTTAAGRAGEEKPATLLVSVGRAINVLDCIGSATRPLPAKSIARATALSLGTTYNVLRTLAHAHYVVAEPDGFVMGPAHPALASNARAVALARNRTIMNNVRDELHAATYLGRFVDGEIELVDIVDSVTAPRVELWVGLQDGAHATAFGKQILATVDAATRSDYLSRHPLEELTAHTVSSRTEFLRELAQDGPVMVEEQEYALGVTCLAVPVSTPAGEGALAVSFSTGAHEDHGPEARYQRHANVLHAAARQLSMAAALDPHASGGSQG